MQHIIFLTTCFGLTLGLVQQLEAVKVSSANKALEGINVTISSTPSDFGGGKKLTITATDPDSLEGLKTLVALKKSSQTSEKELNKKPKIVELVQQELDLLVAAQKALIDTEES